MLIIENGVINITKGDDAVIEVELCVGGSDAEPYTMAENDILIFTVREKPAEEYPALLMVKSIPGSKRIVIRPEDTANLNVGRYSADIQLTMADGANRTVWPELTGSSRYKVKNLKNFIVMPEVTMDE